MVFILASMSSPGSLAHAERVMMLLFVREESTPSEYDAQVALLNPRLTATGEKLSAKHGQDGILVA